MLGIGWLRRHPFAADAVLAAVVSAIALSIHLLGSGLDEIYEVRDPAPWTVALILVAIAPLAWRRQHPIAVVSVVIAAQSVLELMRIDGTGWINVIIAVYSLGAYAPRRQRSLVVAGLGTVIVALLVSGVIAEEIGAASLIGSIAIVVAAYVFGDTVHQRRENLQILGERAERLERERELLARERVLDERQRIARELHDVVAHSVSVMIIQAAAARRSLPDRPDDAQEMLLGVEDTGRRAMDELRRVLSVLRTVDPDSDDSRDPEHPIGDPQPGIDAIADLVIADDDLPVRLSVDPGVSELPDGVAVSVYRLVQEALTNVRRHAGPVSQVDVELTIDDGELTVSVADDGRGAARDIGGDAGFGIIGMQERVQALGGAVAAGPRRGGGWKVHAQIPIRRSTIAGRS